ncbi:NUDIX domain-containing protein [Sphaerisporangium sp. TRM90804]|uniref:NUDIX domain-containing protein n=1 Tax=Sphaerisporangium sp. TRM90804 TaxID=3031113 RepID=UPI002447D6F5|nr:NUDIX domain-containing protein [Sphaerisporangium sp. TRM90804]MDH2424524.1 NUDIX domain-containing protein [Sphaerisporangium sp. TRM90804]
MRTLLARLWRMIEGPLQWRVVRLRNATFMVGVTGVVRDAEGGVLLLEHRFWPEGRRWGLPGGYAKRGETLRETVAREVREETGLEVRVHGLAGLRSGYRLRVEVAYEAEVTGGTLEVDAFEILQARWFPPDALPEGTQEYHRRLVAGAGER